MKWAAILFMLIRWSKNKRQLGESVIRILHGLFMLKRMCALCITKSSSSTSGLICVLPDPCCGSNLLPVNQKLSCLIPALLSHALTQYQYLYHSHLSKCFPLPPSQSGSRKKNSRRLPTESLSSLVGYG